MSNDYIGALQTEHNITNHRLYTMLNYADDRKFYNSQLNDSSDTSVAVGTMYFNVLKTQYFEYDYHTSCTDNDL
ncbi:phospholipase A2-like isoform X2 [Amblyomma americanum]